MHSLPIIPACTQHTVQYTLYIIHTIQDRYATGRFLPSVDLSQDWFLVSGEEENGYTILEFTRNLTSCDMNDLDIEVKY